MSRDKPSALWGALLLLPLFLALTLLLHLQREKLLADARDDIGNDLKLLSGFVNGALQEQDYQRVGALFKEWGGARRDTREILLTAANGFVIARYLKPGTAGETLRLNRRIPYSDKGVANLTLVEDLAPAFERLERQRREIGLVSATMALAFGALAWWYGFHCCRRQREPGDPALPVVDSRELQRARAYIDGILDSLPWVLVGVDRDGRITEWNREAEQGIHIRREDALGLPYTELLPQLEGEAEKVRQGIAEGTPQRVSRHSTVAGGAVHYSEIQVFPLPAHDQGHALIRVEDVTQRIYFEQMMAQTEKLTSLGGLAAGVAHEINSPLSGVLQNCQNVKRRLSKELETNRRVAAATGLDLERLDSYLQRRRIPEFLDMIREAAERASHIVTDMLAFSRRSTGGFEKVSATEMLETALRLCASDYDMKKKYAFGEIELVREFDPQLPLVHCDRTRIEQVLLNLLKNAAQAMAQADTPAPRRIRLRAGLDGEHIRIEVEDNGPGISEEIRRQVFDPFFTTKEPGVGTGLGLSVSHFIITEQHHGDISVTPAPETGSRFTVRLPIQPRQAEPSALSLTA